jgi:hypothetical protein
MVKEIESARDLRVADSDVRGSVERVVTPLDLQKAARAFLLSRPLPKPPKVPDIRTGDFAAVAASSSSLSSSPPKLVQKQKPVQVANEEEKEVIFIHLILFIFFYFFSLFILIFRFIH